MNIKPIKVLVLSSSFKGGHGAFPIFINELIKGFESNQVEVYTAYDVNQAISFYETYDISFSINIGVYEYFQLGMPLYDLYKVINYQWIIDNPNKYLKYNLDLKSIYNRLIYIDKDFFKLDEFVREDYIWLPLGGPNNDYILETDRIDGIFVPMDIRETPKEKLNNIKDEIIKLYVKDFIKKFDFDQSFLQQCLNYIKENNIINQSSFILSCHSYIRMLKRIKMITSIKKHQVYIASDFINPYITGENIHYLPTGNFQKSLELQRKFKFVLNSTPNYEYCIHERITYASCNGSVVITDNNSFLEENKFYGSIKYSKLDKIDEFIDDLINNYNFVRLSQQQFLQQFKMNNAVSKIIENFKNNK